MHPEVERMHGPGTLLAVVASVAIAEAQKPVPQPPSGAVPIQRSRVRPQEIAVTITGCLNGKYLRSTAGAVSDTHTALLNATEFVLEGSRDVMRQLADDHKGHEESITGVAILPPEPSNATVDIKTIKAGRATITSGVRESDGAGTRPSGFNGDARVPVRVRIQSATHLAEHCVPR
jgi:hypothetical protein